MVALWALCAIPRFVALDSDVPRVIVEGYQDEAHLRDEAAKAHEARNFVPFGEWQLSADDQYGFWRPQSPYWVHALAAWLSAFGVRWRVARAFVALHVALSLAVFAAVAWRRLGTSAAFVALVLLGSSWPLFAYSRLALMEGVVLAWLIVAFAGVVLACERGPRSLVGVALACAGAMLAIATKQSGLLFGPPLVLAACVEAWLAMGDEPVARRRALRVAVLAMPLALALALAPWLSSDLYRARLNFNASHYTETWGREHSRIGRALRGLASGLTSTRLPRMFRDFAPVPLVLAATELARSLTLMFTERTAARLNREPAAPTGLQSPATRVELWAALVLLLALTAAVASPHRAIRFQIYVIAPACWLAASLAARVLQHHWADARMRSFVPVALSVVLAAPPVATALRAWQWLAHAEHTLAQLGPSLERALGPSDSVVVGEYAALAVFETKYRHFYVRPGQFNQDRQTLRSLGITHLLTVDGPERDFVTDLLRDQLPRRLRKARKIATLQLREYDLQLLELGPPLHTPPRQSAPAGSDSLGTSGR